MSKQKYLQWRCYTTGLLKEILSNNETQTLRMPIQIFAHLLSDVATRASELNDPRLNALMCRLSLYAISDPNSPKYDANLTNKIIEQGHPRS